MFQYYLSKVNIPKYQIDLNKPASLTINITSVDIKNMVNTPVIIVTKNNKKRLDQHDMIGSHVRIVMGLKHRKDIS